MAFLENTWLWTTLSILVVVQYSLKSRAHGLQNFAGVTEWRRILDKNGAVWRSDVEMKLRKNFGDGNCRLPSFP